MEQLSTEIAVGQTSNKQTSLKERVQVSIDYYTRQLEDLKKFQENLNKNPEFFEEFYSCFQKIQFSI